jgi:hypothetical protein
MQDSRRTQTAKRIRLMLQGSMSEEIIISFAGPFSWPGTPDALSVFDVSEGRKAGIYVWTVPLRDGHLIYCVGETGRTFSARLQEHYMEHAAAMYHVYSPAEFARGEKVALWPGLFDATHRKSVNFALFASSVARFFCAATLQES